MKEVIEREDFAIHKYWIGQSNTYDRHIGKYSISQSIS